MERIPASERTREKLKAVIEGSGEGGGTSELVRLAARLIIEEALEGEARDAVGRDYYARGAAPGAGYRNGYRTGQLRSAEGAIEYSAPQIADRATPFRSAIRELVRGRTAELEALAVEMYARGLSTRDIEALFADGAGQSLLSRSAVSEITERLWAEYEGFAGRDLSEFEVTYLFVDGIAERLHLGQPREAVLAAWGLLAEGKKALLHLAPGTKEDTASCQEFFRDMRRRALPDPLLVVSDGAPGIIRAIEECFPRSLRQRCLAHKMRNLGGKLPDDLWPEFKARAMACYQAASPALARLLRDDIRTTYGRDLPTAVACLEDDFEACIAHLRFPLGHRRMIRTTDEIDKYFSARLPAGVEIGPCSREGHASLSFLRRHGSQECCEDAALSTPTAAEGGGRRPALTRPHPRSDNRPWRSRGCSVQRATSLDRAVPARDAICRVWYPRFARATAWRRAGLEDEGLAAQPLTSLLICGARALLDSAAALPLADKALVSLFGMPGKLDFRITQRFDIVSVGSSALVALSRRLPGLQLHRAQFAGDQGRACPLVIGALSEEMPAQDGELARHRDCRDLMAATGADTQEECAQWTWRLGRGPSCLDQHGPGMRTPALADTTMLSQAETGLPHPRVQPDIADQVLRAGKAAHIADCRDETGGNDEIDTGDRE